VSVSGRFAAQRSAFKPIFPIFVTFRNVLYVRVGKLIVRLWRRSVRERSFEEASGETEVGRRLLAPEPRSLPPLALALRTILQSSARVKKLAAALHSAAAMRPPAPRSANLYTLCPKSAVL